jgi:serine phosphatase RsbU (regulator of sigma subunit)/PAS domain-containing protein
MAETTAGADSTPAQPTAVEVLSRVIEEQRRAEARLRARFLEHGVVDQAVGALTARLDCSPDEAFDQLLEIERRSGRDLLEVAAEVIGRGGGPVARTRVPMSEAVPNAGVAVPRIERAADGDEAARLLLTDTLAWSGANLAGIALILPDGALELIGADGLPSRVVSQWRRIPPQMDSLLGAAVRQQSVVWADAVRGREPVLLGESGPGGGPVSRVHAAVPLWLGRGLIGAVEVGWPSNTSFTAEVRREIAALAGSAAQAVVRARRLPAEPEGFAGWGHPADLDRLREIMDAAWEPMLLVTPTPDPRGPAAGLGIAAANKAALDLIASDTAEISDNPALGSVIFNPIGRRLTESLPWCVPSGAFDAFREALLTGVAFHDPEHTYIDPADTERRSRTVSLSASRLDESSLLVCMRPAAALAADRLARTARLQRMAGTGSWEWDVPAGLVHWSAEALLGFGARTAPGPVQVDRPPYRVHPDDQPEHDRLMHSLSEGRPAQAEFRVVRADGAARHMRVVGEPIRGEGGAVASVFGTVQDVTERRRAETALEIAHIQLAAQRSRAESERQLANLLQQVIMPVEPVRLAPAAGVEVAARYRPAGVGVGVGGDWYGIFPLPDSRLLLTVGDIAGHGFAAATAMAQLYHALHGLAMTGQDSDRLLAWLNAVTCDLADFTLASAVAALYDPATRRLCLANAGHPSPVLVRAGRARTMPRPGGRMLGIDPGSEYGQDTVVLEPGDIVLFYTDGLIERRKHSHDEDTGRLLADAARVEDDFNVYVDRLMERAESDTDDDACLLAVRFS